MILPHDANPGRMEFSERTGLSTSTTGTALHNSTARTRRCRQLKRDAHDPVAERSVARLAVVAGLLAEWDDEDKLAITAAFQRAVELWMASEERKLGNYTGSQMPT